MTFTNTDCVEKLVNWQVTRQNYRRFVSENMRWWQVNGRVEGQVRVQVNEQMDDQVFYQINPIKYKILKEIRK